MIDTGTVRLVILLTMFLYFAGDYSTVIQSIWGNNGEDANQTDSELKRLPEGPPKDGLHLERMVFAAAKKTMDEEDNGRENSQSRLAFGDGDWVLTEIEYDIINMVKGYNGLTVN